MDKDNNDYWHLRTPYDTAVPRSLHERLSARNCLQLYANSSVGAHIASAFLYTLEVRPLSLLTKTPTIPLPQVAAEETAKSLYAALPTLLLRGFAFNAVRVTVYDALRHQFFYMDASSKEQRVTVPGALLSGGVAGCVAQLIYQPAEFVQREAATWPLALKAIQAKPLWRAMPLSCTHASLLTLGDVAAYDLCKGLLRTRLKMRENIALHLPAAVVAGIAASVLSHPAEVIRMRMLQRPLNPFGSGSYYKGSIDCLLKLVREEGVLKLYRGLLPACVRSSSWSVIFWLCVEQLREWEGQTGF